jgi:CDP-2,3-bis-(O-geranylgeranyl)-sn-glycerol synthase
VLLTVANGTPVIAAKILGNNSALPLDGNVTLFDGKPLFGSSKTLRGVLLSILLTTACAPLIGLDWVVGSVVALTAMIGDLFSSFAKRRLGMADSSQFTGLDQIPESLLPLLVCMFLLPLTLIDVAIVTTIFFVGALVLSRILFKLNIRDRPY